MLVDRVNCSRWFALMIAAVALRLGFNCESVATQPLFEQVLPEESGLGFTNALPVEGDLNILVFDYYYNGGGVAIGDINNDGLPDIYLTANLEPNRLFLNRGGLRFEDISEAAGVNGLGKWATGVTLADVNADGWLDIYVCYSGPFPESDRRNELYINQKDLTFVDEAAAYGLDTPNYSTQALFFDLDRDNDLDLFLLNHSVQSYDTDDIPVLRNAEGINSGDKVFLNHGGRFHDVTAGSGIRSSPLGYGLGIAAGDLNNDGWTDVYVANDYAEPDYLYINNKLGGFIEQSHQSLKHMSNFGMGADIADYNNDGLADIVVGDMAPADNYRQKTNMASMNPELFQFHVDNGLHYQYMYNTLQLNRGDLRFSEVAQLAGVDSTDWSWAALFGDVDNDGWKDLLVTNGFRREHANKDFGYIMEKRTQATQDSDIEVKKQVMVELISEMGEGKLTNYMFRNNGDLTFEDKSMGWGLTEETFSNGAALADLDGDGDLDIVINNIDQPALLYKNTTVERGGPPSLVVRFEGPEGNPFGIGAKVTLRAGDDTQVQENFPTRGYLSSIPPSLQFGLGGESADALEVSWPDGRRQSIIVSGETRSVTFNYAESSLPRRSKSDDPSSPPLFADITAKAAIRHKHMENRHDDFADEILLPHKLSRLGPAIAVGDVNGDGLEDVFVGGAARQAAALILQSTSGAFAEPVREPWTLDAGSEDVGATLFDCDGDGDLDLYVASGGNEFPEGDERYADRLYLNDGLGNFTKATERLPGLRVSGAVVETCDFDVDGDLDLFVGGRLVPKRYPSPADSFLLENENGRFVDRTQNLAPGLKELGMVTSALWTDVTSDGQADLVVAGEWMPITVFEKNGQSFEKLDSLDLENEVGWWYSLAEIDVDNDGDTDLVGGNLGLNYKYRASQQEPFSVHANDFDESGSLDIVLSYYNDGAQFPLRGRQCSSQQMPIIADLYKTYHDFGLATLVDIYGPLGLGRSLEYHATNFAHCLIENQGDGRFEFRPLPSLAQLSTVNGILVDDFDEDGHADLVIGGNLYPVEVETIRADASFGLFLKGNGDGDFHPVDTNESGLAIDGDVKGLKRIQIKDASGILVSNNDDRLQLISVNK